MAFSQVLFPKISELSGNGRIDDAGRELGKVFLMLNLYK